MDHLAFSPIEKTVSFYTRNDFAILNCLLFGDYNSLWEYALLAYNDNRGIVDEYGRGVRTVHSDYDVKWLNWNTWSSCRARDQGRNLSPGCRIYKGEFTRSDIFRQKAGCVRSRLNG